MTEFGWLLEGAKDAPRRSMLALIPPPEFAEAAAALSPEFGPGDMHITLVYMGLLPEVDLERLKPIVQSIAQQHAPMQMSVNGAGVFHNSGTAVRLLLVNAIGLDSMRGDLARGLARVGSLGEQRHGFIPHMTLEYNTDGLESGWEDIDVESFPAWTADAVHLVRKDDIIATFPLTGIKGPYESVTTGATTTANTAPFTTPLGAKVDDWVDRYGKKKKKRKKKGSDALGRVFPGK